MSADPTTRRTNWAGNHTYAAERLHEPASLEELREVVRTTRPLRVLGSRHSFNDIADTTGDQVSLRRMPRIFELDGARGRVTVDGGVRYGELCGRIDAAGFALHNLASLPHISVAGACATATHGSGDLSGNLATAVSAMEVVTADGEVAPFARDREPDTFDGTVVALGGLGVVTRLTLDLQPTFRMRQDIYEDLPLARAAEHLEEIMAMADSVSLFTEWRGPLSNRSGSSGASRATRSSRRRRVRRDARDRPDPSDPPDAGRRLTQQLGVPGPGTSGCRTSGWTTPRAPEPSSRANTSSRGGTAPRRCSRSTASVTGSRRCSRSPRSGPSPRIACG